MPDQEVIYLTEDFIPVSKDDPRMAMVKVRMPDGRIVFGFPEKAVENRLFHLGGEGSGFKGHSGRPGEVGGSKNKGSGSDITMKRPTEEQIHKSLQMGVYQVSEGAHIPLERVKYSVELVPVKDIVASESKTPSEELIDIYRKGEQVQPISVRKVSYEKRMKVLDGNHRLKAARTAGIENVWVVAIEDW